MEKIEPLTLPSGGTIDFDDPATCWLVKHAREMTRILWDRTQNTINSEVTVFQSADVVAWALVRKWSIPYAPDVRAPGLVATFAQAQALIGDTLTEEDGMALTAHTWRWAGERMGMEFAPLTPEAKADESEGKGDGAAELPA